MQVATTSFDPLHCKSSWWIKKLFSIFTQIFHTLSHFFWIILVLNWCFVSSVMPSTSLHLQRTHWNWIKLNFSKLLLNGACFQLFSLSFLFPLFTISISLSFFACIKIFFSWEKNINSPSSTYHDHPCHTLTFNYASGDSFIRSVGLVSRADE